MNHVIAPRAESEEPVYRADFAMGEHSVRHLRRIVRLYLKGWGLMAVADAAELAIGELITNVVRHVPGRRCQTLIFRLPDGAGVRVEVADGCPGLPVVAEGDVLDEDGRGLLLVAAVTDKWGVETRRDGGGKTVWFECLAAAPVTPTARPAPRP
ncbi:ATP-binding protein [Streptomyces sp. NBC_00876]|uniref:ATP-binding protein n=1 Tax=Streptomyces sp. NBC_00876 TaxID=2975853 RepID=UPI0038683ACF|nr:ATP-binding protein [Streptomyces sp. NBC_00876]